MPVQESVLETWSQQGSIQQSAATYQAIKKVLEDARAPYHNRAFNVFLQGSYGNDTNIRADSDVDIVICTSEVFYFNTDNLDTAAKANFERRHPGSAQYTYQQFRTEVLSWLTKTYGSDVVPGKKAITIKPNSTRRKADVLVCANFRHYWSFDSDQSENYDLGIVFWKPDGTRIVNFPKQHSENCTTKHQSTNGWLKPTVRALKNMRNRMIDIGVLESGIAPSYYLEGLLSNVPNDRFGQSFQNTFTRCIQYIGGADLTAFTCMNGIHWLVRDNHEVCWASANCSTFLRALENYWRNPG